MAESKQPRKPRTFHSYEERLHAISLYNAGLGSKRIERETGIESSVIRQWLRRYRKYGEASLRPYWRAEKTSGQREKQRALKECRYAKAFVAISTTLEPVVSIARRYKLKYQAFMYYVNRYHPELLEQRERLKDKESIN